MLAACAKGQPTAVRAMVAIAFVLLGCSQGGGPNTYGPTYEGPLPERPGEEGDAEPRDGGRSDDGEAPPPDGGGCASGTVAVLAGGDGSLGGAIQAKGGVWIWTPLSGGAAKSTPAIVATPAGFVGLTRGPSDALQGVAFTSTWSAPSTLGIATTLGRPALAVLGAEPRAVFLSGGVDPNKFFHASYVAGAWSSAEPVTPPLGVQSFGPSAGAVAVASNELVFVQAGDDEGLYTQSRGATWSAASPIPGAGTAKTIAPGVVATSGTFDLVALYVRQDQRICSTTRAGGSWTDRGAIHDLAKTNDPFSAVSIGGATVVVAFRGQDGNGYVADGTIASGAIAWSSASPIGGSTVPVDSAPAIAKGVCGDDLIVVWASNGIVRASRRRGVTWSSPETVTGAAGTRVAVATVP